MRTKAFVFLAMSLLLAFSFSGCADRQQVSPSENDELRGFSEFQKSMQTTIGDMRTLINDDISLYDAATRSEDELPSEFIEILNELSSETSFFLQANGIDIADFFGDNDPRLAVVGMALVELDSAMTATRTTLGGCVLQAIGLDTTIVAGGKKLVTKVLLKSIAKVALRAIPYVGATLAVADFAMCMAE